MIGYLRSMWRCRYFWFNLVRMDLRTRYRRSVLGVGWSLLHPIAMTIILCVVFQALMKPKGGVAEYAPFLLAGLATWNFIMNSTMQGCQCFFLGESYIRQYPAPMAIYPLRTALGAMIHFLIALTVVVAMVCVIKAFIPPSSAPRPEGAAQAQAAGKAASATSAAAEAHPGPRPWGKHLLAFAWVIPGVVLLFLFAWAMAVLAGFANVYFQDTQHLCEVGFQILLYMTPILYDKEMLENQGLGWLAAYNPIAAFLDLIREPVLKGVAPSAQILLTACITLSLVAGSAVYLLSRCQRRLIFQL